MNSTPVLLLPLLVLATSTGVNADAGVESCVSASTHLEIKNPERDPNRIEMIAEAVKDLTEDGFCRAIIEKQQHGLQVLFGKQAKMQRIFPRRTKTLIDGVGGMAFELTPDDPACFVQGDHIASQLLKLAGDIGQVERCSVETFRLVSNLASPHKVQIRSLLSLGGVNDSGKRITEKGNLVAELEETDGQLRFSSLAFEARERFEADGPAFADRTSAVHLPTDWADIGYEAGGLALGEILHGGVAVGDANGDDLLDIYVSRSGANLLLQQGPDGQFTDVSVRAGVADPGNSQAALFADFDNDGDAEIFVVNANYTLVSSASSRRGHALYRNDGGTFVKQMTEFGPIGPASGASAADFDNDGLLDIYVTYYQDEQLYPYHHHIEARDGVSNRLYKNLGGLRFKDVTRSAGVGGNGWSFASAWADYDGDGLIDLYVANDFGDNVLYRNRGDGTLEETTKAAGVVDTANGMSADWGDYNNDGRLDLYVANMYSKTGNQYLPLDARLDPTLREKFIFSVQGNSLYQNLGSGKFKETGRALGAAVAGWAWGSNFVDFNNDGWLDIHVANGFWEGEFEADACAAHWRQVLAATPAMSGVNAQSKEAEKALLGALSASDIQLFSSADLFDNYSFNARERNQLFVNAGGERFVEAGYALGVDVDLEGRGVAVADINQDGALDLVVRSNSRKKLMYLENIIAAPAGFLRVELTGVKSNRDAIGATVTIHAGGMKQIRVKMAGSGFQGQSEGTLHFGLADAVKVDSLQVHWPSGLKEELNDLPSRSTVKLTEGRGITSIETREAIPSRRLGAVTSSR
jgi:hypothetical protein